VTTFRWMGHSTVLVEAETVRVAVDPWRWRDEAFKADLVLVTHEHADHCSPDDIQRALAPREEAIVMCTAAAAVRLPMPLLDRCHVVEEGDSAGHEFWTEYFSGAVRLRFLPHEGPERARGFHPRGHGVSYHVEIEGTRHLFLGDSRALPEHEMLRPDVAFFAVGGLAVMDPDEAADAAAAIRPGLAVPIHWGDLNGRFDLAVRFARLCAERGIAARARPED
jgi:L-ascorbate metabolism protein UlaG (beta-lactamase superfamily)